MSGVSEQLVELLQERHDLRQQVDMRKIAVDQLQRLPVTSDKRDMMTRSVDWACPWVKGSSWHWQLRQQVLTDITSTATYSDENIASLLLVLLPLHISQLCILIFWEGNSRRIFVRRRLQVNWLKPSCCQCLRSRNHHLTVLNLPKIHFSCFCASGSHRSVSYFEGWDVPVF